ncbi:MAG: hypothetical protein JWN04_2391, partial [Myxococcaceae bacterium]|nr:hypothetical protein [Myxococcaceae bacterium]
TGGRSDGCGPSAATTPRSIASTRAAGTRSSSSSSTALRACSSSMATRRTPPQRAHGAGAFASRGAGRMRAARWLEAEESYPEASEALDLIGEMFLIERDLPDWGCITDDGLRTRALEQICETRQTRTRPLVEALAAWARAQRALKGSRLGEAVTYLNNQWDGLLVFLDDPRVPLSNNAAERSLRGPIVGRKNFAGCKSVRGTEVAAVLYTLLESAGVEPRDYLHAAAEAALTGKPPLLPHVYREQLRAERAAMRSASVTLPAFIS